MQVRNPPMVVEGTGGLVLPCRRAVETPRCPQLRRIFEESCVATTPGSQDAPPTGRGESRLGPASRSIQGRLAERRASRKADSVPAPNTSPGLDHRAAAEAGPRPAVTWYRVMVGRAVVPTGGALTRGRPEGPESRENGLCGDFRGRGRCLGPETPSNLL